MEIIYIISGFIFGSILGSFSGVLLERIPREEDFVSKPSYCTNCNTPLRFYHNIPVLSWLALRGKCSYCKSQIPSRLFLIEFFSGLFFSLIVYFIGLDFIFLFIAIIVYLVIVVLRGLSKKKREQP